MASEEKDSCILNVRVQPKASSNQVLGYDENILRLRVTAPPTDGKANAGVIALLAKTLGVSKSRLQIVRGQTSRNKAVSVDNLTEQEVRQRVEAGSKN